MILLRAAFLAVAAAAAAFPAEGPLEAAEALLAAGKPAEARARIEERISSGGVEPGEKALLLEALGRCHRAEGRPWDAETAFAGALEARPGFFEAASGRGEVFLDLAAGTADAALPSGPEVRALAADARRAFEAAERLRPGDGRALRGLARARILDLDFAGAAAAASAILARGPEDADAHHLLAEALRAGGDRAGAAKAEERCLALDPGRTAASVRLVGDLAATGDREGARRVAREALLREPGADDAYRALWEAEARDRRFEAVEETVLAVLAKHPDHPRALHYLGFAQLSAGRREAALETFRRKAALEPGNAQVRVQVGQLLASRGDLAGGEKVLVEALAKLGPEGPDRDGALAALHRIAVAHGADRRHGDAERIFGRLVEADPGDPEFRLNHAISLRRLGRYGDAEKEVLEAVGRTPFDGAPRNELGLLYLGWGRTEDARRLFEESMREDQRTTAPLENLGNLARAAGRPAEALEFFREAHRRAVLFRLEDDRLKYRRLLDAVARDREAAERK